MTCVDDAALMTDCTFMIAENFHTGLGVRVVGWFEAQFGDSCNYQTKTNKQIDS